MNRLIRSSSILVVLTAFAAMASAASGPSVEQGKALFNSTALGTNGKSCAVCHPGGKGLEESADSDAKELEKISNTCIQKALKGKALAVGSDDLSSLVMYQKSLKAK